jgi:hypothetical protein
MIDLDEIDRDPWPTYPVNKDELRRLDKAFQKLIQHLQICEGALEFYATEANWEKHPFEPSRIDMDNGRVARRILFGEEG